MQMGWLMRSKTLANFEEIISMFTTVREEYPQAVKDALDHFAPTWLSEMEKIISEDVVSTLTRDPGLLGLRNASFRVSALLNEPCLYQANGYRSSRRSIATLPSSSRHTAYT